MTAAEDPVKLMKQEVGKAAANLVKSGSIVGLGTGSTTAYTIQFLGDRLKSGELKDIVGVPTSFQSEVLAKQYGVPLTTLDAIDHIDIAIDGADEVDPQKNLIKGGGAAHTREKVVDYLANQFIVVVDSGKLGRVACQCSRVSQRIISTTSVRSLGLIQTSLAINPGYLASAAVQISASF